MKTILLLTDFSENANHAALSAIKLCSKLHANLLLFNNHVALPVTSYYGAGPWVPDDPMEHGSERKEKLAKVADKLTLYVKHLDAQHYKPVITHQCGEGELGQNVRTVVHENNIELIVMGASTDSTIDHILNGSDTSKVIDHSDRPILVIPPNTSFKNFSKITLATDFNGADLNAIRYLVKLGKVFNAHLEIVHVDPLDKKGAAEDEREAGFKSMVESLNYTNLTYTAIKGKDIVKRLNRLCDDTASDVLSVIYYPHTFFIRMLHQSVAKKVLINQKIPLLIVPSALQN
ncbi:universal stress protein [uncultured Mucilaginibacter sp.]|uniref:universal stress protein n=1 Tax=uncultured Mucilaginibacter sp. TaxID=797541 RepID=UPI0025EB83A4|nr:universal stress protein [uncultured Mucilaginibacter sp.]